MELNFKIKDKSDKSLKLREENLTNFKKKGFPNKREEDWKFTDLEKFLKDNFDELNNDNLNDKNPDFHEFSFIHNSIKLINGKLQSFDFKSENLKDKNCFSITNLDFNHHLNFANNLKDNLCKI